MANEQELKVQLSVNGNNIEMNEFVQKMVGNLIWAILKSLRLEEEPKTAVFNLQVRH
jgi:hypothetical protein